MRSSAVRITTYMSITNNIIDIRKFQALMALFLFLALPSLAQKPVITGIDKIKSPVSNIITIVGSGFSNNPNQVRVQFGAVAAEVVTATENLLEVKVPAGATYETISVTNLTSGLSDFSNRPFLLTFGGSTFDNSKVSTPYNFLSGSELRDLCLCDFDGDGLSDVATANKNSTSISVFQNNSTISNVSLAGVVIPSIGEFTLNIDCKDLDGDGKPEIVLSRFFSGDRVFYLRNNSTLGNISFSPPTSLVLGTNNASRIAIEDLDLDGKPEIAVSEIGSNEINILSNESTIGNINFNPVVTKVPVTNANSLSGIEIRDLNGNGRPEIITSSFQEANLFVIPNKSTPGNLIFGDSKQLDVSGFLIHLAVGDLDLDNKPDIIVTKLTDNEISVLINNFDPNADPDADNIEFFTETSFATAELPWGLDLGDLNGDGKVDIAVASISANNELTIFENNSTAGSLSISSKSVSTTEKTRNISIGDVDGDAKPDLVFTSIDQNNVTVLRNENCPEPRIMPMANQTLCIGSELTLKALPVAGATYQWTKTDGGGASSVQADTDSIYTETFAAGSDGTYKYRVDIISEGGACNDWAEVNVTVLAQNIPSETPAINDPAPVCEGENVTITANVPSINPTLVWTMPDGSTVEGNTLELTNVTPAMAGRYLLSFEVNSCQTASDTTLLQVIGAPSALISAPANLTICQGTIPLSVPAGNSYQWKRDGSNISGATSNTYSADQTGSYSVTITNSDNCSFEASPVDITVLPVPQANFTNPGVACTGIPVTFTDGSTTDSGQTATYLWDFGDGGTSADQNPTYTFSTAGTYNMTLTVSYEDASCTNTTSAQSIVISDPPNLEILADGPLDFCEGESVNLSIGSGVNIGSIMWSTGETTNSINVTSSGTYSADVTTVEGCTVNADITVSVFPQPQITISASETEVVSGFSLEIAASGANTYFWSPPTFLDNPDLPNPVVSPPVGTADTTITYTVEGTDLNGCLGTATITITILNDPSGEINVTPMKAILPEGEPGNRLWIIEDIESFPDCTVSIFNRSGKKIFEETGYTQSWDATYNGNDLPEGVYYFVITCGGKQAKSGSVTVIR